MTHYSSGLPYLEDIVVEITREAQCMSCEIEEEVEGTHYRDSETFVWECPKCLYRNETDLPVYSEPDPNETYDRWRDERNGLTFP